MKGPRAGLCRVRSDNTARRQGCAPAAAPLPDRLPCAVPLFAVIPAEIAIRPVCHLCANGIKCPPSSSRRKTHLSNALSLAFCGKRSLEGPICPFLTLPRAERANGRTQAGRARIKPRGAVSRGKENTSRHPGSPPSSQRSRLVHDRWRSVGGPTAESRWGVHSAEKDQVSVPVIPALSRSNTTSLRR